VTFEEYLITKKIDSSAFNKAELREWEEWKDLFIQMSPASFTARKLYLINKVRRKYTLATSATPPAPAAPAAPRAKPVIRPKIN
jgi:hypothetical protein